MSKKLKFRPSISRIKLNPEQAVLACVCWNKGGFATNTEDGTYTYSAPMVCNGYRMVIFAAAGGGACPYGGVSVGYEGGASSS